MDTKIRCTLTLGSCAMLAIDVLGERTRTLSLHRKQRIRILAGVDDGGLTPKDQRLVVIGRFLSVLRTFAIDHCIIRRRPFPAE